ncbi:MAG: DUF2807 domain-containing protein [Bacteroidetes bacterium]|nr:DUF2807 domain-containing protein [Bacteroidota bacterium]
MKTSKNRKPFFKQSFIIKIVLISTIYLTGCTKKTNPTPTSVSFKNVSINGSCNVTLMSGAANKLGTASPGIITFTIGNTLMINGAGNVSVIIGNIDTLFSNGMSNINNPAVLNLKNIVIACNGASDSLSLSINASDSINVIVNGSGKYKFTGNTPKLNVVSNGLGCFSGYSLHSTNSNVTINGDGNSEVYVTQTLNAFINANGTLYYKGNPVKVNPYIIGTGKLIKM